MGEVTKMGDSLPPRIGYPHWEVNAAQRMVARMFTDAVFNQDIRVIQLIINRIDGGLPKDSEVDEYQTLFGDCIKEILSMSDMHQTKVFPDDTVMMALSKSLYDIATRDIYGDAFKNGKKRPGTEAKQERDTAMRMVLERAGGRKTAALEAKPGEPIELAPWVAEALPQTTRSEPIKVKETPSLPDVSVV